MNVFQINSHDNVAVAVDAVAKGSVVTAGGKTFTVCQDIPAGIKWPCSRLPKAKTSSNTAFPSGRLKLISRWCLGPYAERPK